MKLKMKRNLSNILELQISRKKINMKKIINYENKSSNKTQEIKTVIIIPARFESSRLPGKPLKYINGIRKNKPITLPKNLWAHSHQKITLNSSSVILKFCNLNSGISLYKLKYATHSAFENGGKNPLNNSHSVIDNPESVNLVNPPTVIIDETKTNIIINQKDTKFSRFLFMYIYK